MSIKIAYRPEIDGLRSIAVMSVILFHAKFSVSGVNPISGGFLGVDIFFVISGYLITSIILKGLETGSFAFTDFYERRARRILPVLFTVMIVSMPVAWRYLLPSDMIDYAKSIIYSTLFSSNFWFWSEDPYWAAESSLKPFLHTWSLAVEEQFYLVMPLVLLMIHKIAKGAILYVLLMLALASLAFAVWASSSYPEFSFYMLPTRMWELLAGSVLAVREIKVGRNNVGWAEKLLPPVGLIMICLPFLLFDEKTKHPSFMTMIPIAGTMMVIWYARRGELVTNVLSSRPFVGIGLISYGLYLWHFTIFAFGRMIFESSSNAQAGILIALIFLATIPSYFLIEKPFRNRERIQKKILIATLSALLLIILGFSGAASNSGYSFRVSSILDVPKYPKGHLNNYQWIMAPVSQDRRIILIGDSHMMAIEHSVKKFAGKYGFDFAKHTVPGCQFILGLNRVRKGTNKPHPCSKDMQQKRLNFLKQSKPSIVILGGRLPLLLEEDRFNNQEGGYEGEMEDYLQNDDNSLVTIEDRRKAISQQYKSTISAIMKMGHSVVLIYPIPAVGWHVPKLAQKRIGKHYLQAGDVLNDNPISTSYSVFKNRVSLSYSLLDDIPHPGIVRVYPESIFCNTYLAGRCATHDVDNLFYIDDDHLSPVGADMLVKRIFEQIGYSE